MCASTLLYFFGIWEGVCVLRNTMKEFPIFYACDSRFTNQDFNTIFFLCKSLCIFQKVHGDLDAGLQQRQKILENQIQAADRALKSTANKLARMGAFQLENAANQLNIAKSMETVAANVLTTNGLNDVNRCGLCILVVKISIKCKQIAVFSLNGKLQIGLKSMIEY